MFHNGAYTKRFLCFFCQSGILYHTLHGMCPDFILFKIFFTFKQWLKHFSGLSGRHYEFPGNGLWSSGQPFYLSVFYFSTFYLSVFSFLDKIKIDTGNPAFFIWNVISHIVAAFCNLTGFCNILRRTRFTVKIKKDSLIPVVLQFFYQWLMRVFLFSGSWYIMIRKYPSLLSEKIGF